MREIRESARSHLGFYMHNFLLSAPFELANRLIPDRLELLGIIDDNVENDSRTSDIANDEEDGDDGQKILSFATRDQLRQSIRKTLFQSNSGSFHNHQYRKMMNVLKHFAVAPKYEEHYETNALFIREEFSLDPIDTEILMLALRHERSHELEDFFNDVIQVMKGVAPAIASVIWDRLHFSPNLPT